MMLRVWSQVLGLVCCLAGCARPDAPRATDSSSPKAAPAVAIDDSPGSAPDAASEPPVVDRRIFAEAANAFGFDLYGKVRTTAGNVVVSPATLGLALAMTWAGARGETAEQMARALHFSGREDEMVSSATELLASLNNPMDARTTLRVLDRLFVQESFEYRPRVGAR